MSWSLCLKQLTYRKDIYYHSLVLNWEFQCPTMLQLFEYISSRRSLSQPAVLDDSQKLSWAWTQIGKKRWCILLYM